MAKQKLTKDQINQNNLRKQYNAQVNRIKAGYRDISNRGGLFSIGVDEIIGERKNPDRYYKRDITKLKNISKESLYRMAKTDTGKSGYSILAERREKAGRKGAFELRVRKEYKKDIEKYNYLETPSAKSEDYRNWRKDYFSRLAYEHEIRQDEAREYIEDSEYFQDFKNSVGDEWKNYSKWEFDEWVEQYRDDTIKEYEAYEAELKKYEPRPEPDENLEPEEIESPLIDFVSTGLDNILSEIDKIDYGEISMAFRQELENAMNELGSDEAVAEFLESHGNELIDAVQHVAKYLESKDKIYGTYRDLRVEHGFNHWHNQALKIMWNGEIPLDSAVQLIDKYHMR